MQQLDFWIRKRASQSPNNIALIQIESGEKWTYRELMRRVKWWSKEFRLVGLSGGERIAVLTENSIECFAMMFACRLNELIYVPLNSKLSVEELRVIVEDCKPSLVVADDAFEARAKEVCSLPVVKAKSEETDDESSFLPWRDEPRLPWYIIYTGGTTGKPKGVVLSHEAVTANALNTVMSWGLTERDCTLNYMPLFHTGGINALSLPVLLAGGTVVVGKKFDPERAIRAVNEYKTTISLFVPTMYQLMTETKYFKAAEFPTVRVFLSGGAPCPKPIYERFHAKGLRFKEGYGLTEAGPNNFVIDEELALAKKGAVGKSMLFNEVRVVNGSGEPCAVDEVGELWLKGSHVFSCYWNNEEETVASFSDGWLKTGDLARFDEDGDFYIVGRIKEMVISGGENVYPQEVEQCLITHSAVKEAAVIGVPDETWGECVVAFVVIDAEGARGMDAGAFVAELKAFCRDRLANYKVPKQIHVIDELPKTPVGKIDKKQLVEMAVYL